jgi:hypothetical protein
MKPEKILAIVFSALCLFCLSSCEVLDFFIDSFFPPTLANTADVADLSSVISENTGELYTFSVERGGDPASDYVLLFSQEPFTGPHILVLNSSLIILKRMENLPESFEGRWTMTDAAGMIIMGNAVFDPESINSEFTISPPSRTLFNSSISIYTTLGALNVINLRIVDDRKLMYDMYDNVWTDPSTYTIFPKTIRSDGFFKIIAAYADYGSSRAILLLSERDSKTSYCVSIPFEDILTGLPDEILAAYPPIITLPYIPDFKDIGFTDGLLIIFDGETKDFTAYDLATGQTRRTFHDSASRDKKMSAYSRTGSGFYVFDARKRTILRYKAWWQE